MAKRKKPSRPPQARHSKKSTPSRHDKRKRLLTPNPLRKRTTHAKVPLTDGLAAITDSMGKVLHGKIAFRLAIIFSGALLDGDLKTASAWFQAAEKRKDMHWRKEEKEKGHALQGMRKNEKGHALQEKKEKQGRRDMHCGGLRNLE